MSSRQFSNISAMKFELTNEQNAFLAKVKKACIQIRPMEEECYLHESRNEKIVSVFSPIGMLGCPVSSKYGGLGYDMLTYCLALELVGEEGSSLRTFFSAHTSIGQLVIQAWGTEEQRARLLPDTTSGKKIMAFALTEPAAGSDPGSMVTSYEKRGNNYFLNGKKHWIGNGTFAKTMTTYAKDMNTGKISAFIVEREDDSAGRATSEGMRTEEIKNKVGLLTVKNAEIYFNDFKVNASNLLGKEGQGLSVAYSALIDGRMSVAAGAIGVMCDCLAESIRYSKQRSQHGSPLAKKQLIQQHIAQIATNIESSRWLVYRAALAVQNLHAYIEGLRSSNSWINKLNRHNKEYARLRTEADYLSSVAKLYASNCSFDSANRAVQIFGSAAYTKNARVARHFLDSRATIIYEGANEVLELKIASSNLGEGYNAL